MNKKLKHKRSTRFLVLNKTMLIIFSVLVVFIFAAIYLLIYFETKKGFLNSRVSLLIYILTSVLFVIITFLIALIISFLYKKTAASVYMKFSLLGEFMYDEKMLRKLIAKKQKKKQSDYTLVLVSMKHFKEDLLTSDDTTKMQNYIDLVSETLMEDHNTIPKLYYCFDYSDTFYFYIESTDIKSISKRIVNIVQLTNVKAHAQNIGYFPENLSGCIIVNDINRKEVLDELLAKARIASYRNDTASSNEEICVYDPEIDLLQEAISDLDSEIVNGLNNNEFEMFYQPQFDINLNRFTGAEALIRWHHPQRGLVFPGGFIKQAEKSGRVIDIDRYVLEKVCYDIATWTKEGKRLLPISVNLSRRSTFDPSILDFISNVIKKYNVNPLLLKIELTESIASKNVLYTDYIMRKIKGYGIKVALDDVGTGYSSMAVLKDLPIDVAKLDKSFFDDIEIDQKARDVVLALTTLCRSLNMYVLGEGIQTSKQISIVKKLGVDCIQGFFYSQALQKVKYEAFLLNNKFENKQNPSLVKNSKTIKEKVK